MSDKPASETPSAPRVNGGVRVEADAYGFYWRNKPENTLPPPDLVTAYNRNKPLPRAGVENRKAFIVGSGIAGLAAAFYLIRDGHMPGRNITILDSDDIAGGSLDGAGDAETGYILRGGREMCFTYENFWDVFQDVPALELPEGYSVLDEYRLLNDNDPTYSKARLMHRQGEIKDFSTFGLSRSQQWELTRLLFKRKEELDDITVEQYFSKGFLQTNFWVFWRTMFAFQNWHSLLEMKLYMHRFLDLIDGLNDLSSLVYAKYNQYDSFVRPLLGWLGDKGVQVQLNTRVHDLAVEIEGARKTVTKIVCSRDGQSETIAVGTDDIVIALTGSMTEGTAYGDLDHAPTLAVDRPDPGPESGWALWRNLAAKSAVFGKPEKFCGDVDQFDLGIGHAHLQAVAVGREAEGAGGQRPLFGQGGDRRHHHLHRFKLASQLHLWPSAAFPEPAEGRAGAMGLRAVHGSERRFREESRCRPAPAARFWRSCASTSASRTSSTRSRPTPTCAPR